MDWIDRSSILVQKKIKMACCSNQQMTHFIKSGNEPIELYVTDDQYYMAEKRANELGVLKNSITKGKSNGWGMLGCKKCVRECVCVLLRTYIIRDETIHKKINIYYFSQKNE